MRAERNIGILFSTAFFLAGIFLLRESVADSQWYTDVCMLWCNHLSNRPYDRILGNPEAHVYQEARAASQQT